MRLLIINPNTSDSVTELIGAEARRSASAGTGLTVLTAPFGVAYIETRRDADVRDENGQRRGAQSRQQRQCVVAADRAQFGGAEADVSWSCGRFAQGQEKQRRD